MEALANWLWQGSIIALVASAALRVCRSITADARYRVWWTTLAIVLAMPLILLLTTADVALVESPAWSGSAPALFPVSIPALPRWLTTAVLAFWAVWAAVSALRVAGALVALRRARRLVRPFPPEREARLANWMALRSRGRRAPLVLSGDVRFAAVLGGRTPAIAISPAAANALDDRDLDRIVVHEWAHVQRRDDRARLLQLMIRAVAGLHPGVWWLDRQIHLDRETACDDWAVNLTGSAKHYAACLMKLASLDAPARDMPLSAAIASSEVSRRVVRLLDTHGAPVRHSRFPAIVVTGIVIGTALGVARVPLIAIEAALVEAATEAPGVHPIDDADPAAPAPSVHPTWLPTHGRDTTTVAAVRARSRTPAAATPGVASPVTVPLAVLRISASVPEAPGPATPDVHVAGELPGVSTPLPALPAPTERAAAGKDSAPTPWSAAAEAGASIGRGSADAGVSIGRGSQKAATATAGFFNRLGKSIGRSF